MSDHDPARPMVSVNMACAIAQVTRRTMYNWMDSGKVTYVLTAGGQRRIVADTLFRPAEPERTR